MYGRHLRCGRSQGRRWKSVGRGASESTSSCAWHEAVEAVESSKVALRCSVEVTNQLSNARGMHSSNVLKTLRSSKYGQIQSRGPVSACKRAGDRADTLVRSAKKPGHGAPRTEAARRQHVQAQHGWESACFGMSRMDSTFEWQMHAQVVASQSALDKLNLSCRCDPAARSIV